MISEWLKNETAANVERLMQYNQVSEDPIGGYGMKKRVQELITRLRMVDAEKLLKTHIPIAEIAKSLGYTTYNGFAAAFKKYYGVCPEEMRTKL